MIYQKQPMEVFYKLSVLQLQAFRKLKLDKLPGS